MTSSEFKEDIELLSKELDLPIKIMICVCNTVQESQCIRYSIFEYPTISHYTKILYLDVDILIQNDINTLFTFPLDDKVYLVNEPGMTIDSKYHGQSLFDFNKVDSTIKGKNNGVLLFNNTDSIKSLFSSIIESIQRLNANNTKLLVLDQQYINYYGVTLNMLDTTLLEDYVFLSNKLNPVSPLDSDKCIMNHMYGHNNHMEKIKRIEYHLMHILQVYSQLIKVKSEKSEKIPFKQYTWGPGNIIFDKTDVIMTTWGRGRYKCLYNTIYEINWAGMKHIAIFDTDYMRYTSICLNNLSMGHGYINTALTDTIPGLKKNGNKYLVYFCVFHNKGYLDLLEYLLLSLQLFSKNYDSIEYLILTSESMVEHVNALVKKLEIPLLIKLFNFQSEHEAGCARLHIFEYEHIHEYSKILYLDTDIIIQGDLMKILDCLQEDVLYAKNEHTINGIGHGGLFFDFTKYDRNTPSLNSGVLLFKNSPLIKSVFDDINMHISNLKKVNTLWPGCMDQPFISFHFIKNSMCNLEAISEYVCIAEKAAPPLTVPIIIGHFTWPIGNPWHKMGRMKAHLQELIESNITTLSKDSIMCLNTLYKDLLKN